MILIHFFKGNIMPTLEQLHNAYIESKEPEENYNFDDDTNEPEENEFNTWQPVARDIEFEKHIAKLKAMQNFNRGK